MSMCQHQPVSHHVSLLANKDVIASIGVRAYQLTDTRILRYPKPYGTRYRTIRNHNNVSIKRKIVLIHNIPFVSIVCVSAFC
jgi:hypothetical protein